MQWALIIFLWFAGSHANGPDRRIVLQTYPTRDACTSAIIPAMMRWQLDLQEGHYWDGQSMCEMPPTAKRGTYMIKCVPQKN